MPGQNDEQASSVQETSIRTLQSHPGAGQCASSDMHKAIIVIIFIDIAITIIVIIIDIISIIIMFRSSTDMHQAISHVFDILYFTHSGQVINDKAVIHHQHHHHHHRQHHQHRHHQHAISPSPTLARFSMTRQSLSASIWAK